jgi:polygalacturonase
MTNRLLAFCLLFTLCLGLQAKPTKDLWPDGTPIDAWFSDTATVDVSTLGRRFVVTDYGVSRDSNLVQTKALQAVIDRCASEGGGVVVIPAGTFLSGSLYFKQGTHLLVEAGGKLKGSDRVEDFDIRETRIEGQTCKYYTALVNVDGVDGMVISGPGTIDGNGYHYWRQFWLRREWNRECTNKDEQRPRLVYISNSSNITVQNVRTVNSPFWTNHLYRSHHVRYLNCYIYSSTEDVKGPSTDAIDIDVCHDILVNGCYMNVNDDAIAIKGGKGTWADQDPNNGPNKNIIIQNCRYGVVHGCLTLGSESVYDRNIILRNIQADKVNRVLWLKMRPDTPQHYEYVRVENITGNTGSFLVVRPWTQFFNLEKRDDMPLSQCNNIQIKGIRMNCRNFFDVGTSDKYALKDFSFEDIDVKDEKNAFRADVIAGTVVKNLTINGTKLPNQK